MSRYSRGQLWSVNKHGGQVGLLPQFLSPDPTVQAWPVLGVTPGRRNVNEARSHQQVHFSLISLPLHLFYFLNFIKKIFWPRHVAFRILVPNPGSKPHAPAVEAQSINHWSIRKFPPPPLLNENLRRMIKAKVIVCHSCFRNYCCWLVEGFLISLIFLN